MFYNFINDRVEYNIRVTSNQSGFRFDVLTCDIVITNGVNYPTIEECFNSILPYVRKLESRTPHDCFVIPE